MKKIFIFLLMLSANFVLATHPHANMNMGLHNKLSNSTDRSALIDVLVKGDISQIQKFVSLHQGKFIGSAGNIASLKISVEALSILIQRSFVQRVESRPHHYEPLCDTMRMLCRVDEVQQGMSPLTQAYDGTGVVLGYIDSGIDLHHPDFQDINGKTRVKWLWDTTLPVAGNTPQPYGYGQEWNNDQIDSGHASAHTGEAVYGHGTYVAGIGSSNGLAIGHFQGVAPGSDIIMVAYDFNAQDTVSRMLHAVEYIFTKADQLGKPCVINASLGEYDGSHDGLDLEAQYIKNLLNQHTGRVIVSAAGNYGTYPYHVGRTSVAGDTAFTWFKYNPNYGGAYIQIFSEVADFANVKYSVGADKVTPYYDFRGQIPFAGIAGTLNNLVQRNLYNGPNRIGIIQTYASLVNGVYELEVFVLPDSVDYNWRFISTGNGQHDSWSLDYEWQTIPNAVDCPDIIHYWAPDTTQTIVSGMNCLDEVISVANYYNTDRHRDVNDSLRISAGDSPLHLAESSSRGPTRDGRNKPDVSAPGHHIVSCGVLTQIASMITTQPEKVALGGYHVTGGGTSAAAPVIAGIAALYLQQFPTADWSDVKAAIINCAFTDQYTWGPYPNPAWGAGKVDAFGSMTACGFVGTGNQVLSNTSISVYPNPASEFIAISWPDQNEQVKYQVELIDPVGKLVNKYSAVGSNFRIDTHSLIPGIYTLKVTQDRSFVAAKKVLISR